MGPLILTTKEINSPFPVSLADSLIQPKTQHAQVCKGKVYRAEIPTSSAEDLPDGVRQFPNTMRNMKGGNTLHHNLYPSTEYKIVRSNIQDHILTLIKMKKKDNHALLSTGAPVHKD